MITRRLPVLALLGLLAGCAGGEPSPSVSSSDSPSRTTAATAATTTATTTAAATAAATSPPEAPRTITPDDNGATFTMQVGGSSTLLLPAQETLDPVVTGVAVELIRVTNVTGSTMREWELRAVEPGTATIRGTSPDFVVTLTVS